MKSHCRRSVYLLGFVMLALSADARFANSKSKRADNYDEPIFFSLPVAMSSGCRFQEGVIYEISDDWRFPVLGIGKGKDVLIGRKYGHRVLIRPYSADYAEGDIVEGHYFRYRGNERYSDSKIAQETKVPLLEECSPREAARYDEDKERRLEQMAQELHEKERWHAVMAALEGIDGLVGDERIKKSAYGKAADVYDEAYDKYKSHEKAAGFASEFGRRILKGFADEKERQMREWEAAHPEEAEARRKAEAERLARIAQEKLAREIEKTRKILEKFESDLRQYGAKNPKNPIPEKYSDLAKTLGARMLPPYDSWNNRLVYEHEGLVCGFVSAGADGKFGTEDDMRISVAQQATQSETKNGIAALHAELESYKCAFAESVCGFKFGAMAEKGYGTVKERIVPLRKPFRGIENALLIYEGEYAPRLVAIRLIGVAKDGYGSLECEKIVALLERNYDIKIPKSTVSGYVRAEYATNKGFAITVRNDGVETENGDPAYYVEFRDVHLSQLLSQIDDLMSSKNQPEESAQQAVQGVPAAKEQKAAPRHDEDGLDILNM